MPKSNKRAVAKRHSTKSANQGLEIAKRVIEPIERKSDRDSLEEILGEHQLRPVAHDASPLRTQNWRCLALDESGEPFKVLSYREPQKLTLPQALRLMASINEMHDRTFYEDEVNQFLESAERALEAK